MLKVEANSMQDTHNANSGADDTGKNNNRTPQFVSFGLTSQTSRSAAAIELLITIRPLLNSSFPDDARITKLGRANLLFGRKVV